MSNALPTFHALLSTAVSLHLSAIPLDGTALVLEQAIPCTPLLPAGLTEPMHAARTSLEGAIAALQTVHGHAPTRARLDTCLKARRAYHAAMMAYFGVDVSAEAA